MKLTIELPSDTSMALRRFAEEVGPTDFSEAAAYALREYLITTGYLELPYELDEDSETDGTA